MEFMEFVDLVMLFSYFFIMFCFLLFAMSEEIRRGLYKLKELFYYKVLGKKTLEQNTSESRYKPKTIEERKEEAVDYLVEKYLGSKKREEEYRRKLKSYGKFRRWVFHRIMNLRNACMFVLETFVKPYILFAMAYSTYLSIWFGTKLGPNITKFTQTCVPMPFNHVLDVFILFPIGFSPGILSIILGYYVEKKKLKKILEDYGVKT